MVRIAYTTVAALALLMGVATGWTWQQWQPSAGMANAGVATAPLKAAE
ncbi:hypothetical protein ACNI3K_01245 [Demequina sp. SO4-13]